MLVRDVDNAANKVICHMPRIRLMLSIVQVELDLGCTLRISNMRDLRDPRDCSPRPLFKRFFFFYLVLCITPL